MIGVGGCCSSGGVEVKEGVILGNGRSGLEDGVESGVCYALEANREVSRTLLS